MRIALPSLLFLLVASCTQTVVRPAPASQVQKWGSMREALKLGHSEGRVVIADAVQPTSFGVGALAGLAGEITVMNGQVFIAEATADGAAVRSNTASEQATLLALAETPAWQSYPLPACASYTELETAIAQQLRAAGFDLNQATAVWVSGIANQINGHVIHGSCPIANPDGPKPWRLEAAQENMQLIGFFIDNAAGEWTHHNHRSHLHILNTSFTVSGHLDEVSFLDGAVLRLPIAQAGD